MKYYKDIPNTQCIREDDEGNRWYKDQDGDESDLPYELRKEFAYLDQDVSTLEPITKEQYDSFGSLWFAHPDEPPMTEEQVGRYFEMWDDIYEFSNDILHAPGKRPITREDILESRKPQTDPQCQDDTVS